MNIRAQSSTVRVVIFLLTLCAIGAFLKVYFVGVTYSNDYAEYVQTAQYLGGDHSVAVIPHRLLKPLNPLLIAGLAHFGDYETVFLIQAIILYAAFVIAMYYFARQFLENTFTSALIAGYVALSYPMLKYGIDILTETGALLFYVISLLLTMLYLKQPSWRLVLVNAFVVTIGFLWKEYSVVSAVIFGLAILFHAVVPLKQRIAYIAAYAAIFLGVHLPLQIYVFLAHGYTYLSWYSVAVNGAILQNEFTLKNIIKSTAALLGVLWLAVLPGFSHYRSLTPWQRRFWQVSIAPPFMAYAWGYVSSRLLFVMAPPFLLVAGVAMRDWSRSAQITIFLLAISANITWFFLSYHIVL